MDRKDFNKGKTETLDDLNRCEESSGHFVLSQEFTSESKRLVANGWKQGAHKRIFSMLFGATKLQQYVIAEMAKHAWKQKRENFFQKL